jgi:hypothetical protein
MWVGCIWLGIMIRGGALFNTTVNQMVIEILLVS